VPTVLIATASINFAFWFIALPFGYYATLQVIRKFNQLDKQKAKQIAVEGGIATSTLEGK